MFYVIHRVLRSLFSCSTVRTLFAWRQRCGKGPPCVKWVIALRGTHARARARVTRQTDSRAGKAGPSAFVAPYFASARVHTRAASSPRRTLLTNYVVLVWPVREVACSRCCRAQAHIYWFADECTLRDGYLKCACVHWRTRNYNTRDTRMRSIVLYRSDNWGGPACTLTRVKLQKRVSRPRAAPSAFVRACVRVAASLSQTGNNMQASQGCETSAGRRLWTVEGGELKICALSGTHAELLTLSRRSHASLSAVRSSIAVACACSCVQCHSSPKVLRAVSCPFQRQPQRVCTLNIIDIALCCYPIRVAHPHQSPLRWSEHMLAAAAAARMRRSHTRREHYSITKLVAP